jgi:hypothetical protein
MLREEGFSQTLLVGEKGLTPVVCSFGKVNRRRNIQLH